MMSLDTRRARLEKLYDLRRKINAEIDHIAGEIEEELVAMRRARLTALEAGVRVKRANVAPCGTDRGYYRHRRTLNEPACDACKLAHRVYEAQRRRRALEAAE